MTLSDILLICSGALGACLALGHGYLLERYIVRPLAAATAAGPVAPDFRGRFVGPLIHFTTAAWFACGLALIAAATVLGPDTRTAVCYGVAAAYLYGALANLLTSRGRHPGGWLMVFILLLLTAGMSAG